MSIFKTFGTDDIVTANATEVTIGMWTGDTGSLTTIFTGSQGAFNSATAQYYTNVYNTNPYTDSAAEVQFAVAYGHIDGGGNTTLANDDNATLSTQTQYYLYRQLVLEPGDTHFTFYGNYTANHIYAINIQRARLKERVDAGNWSLKLSGSNGTFTFIDDSGQTQGVNYGRAGAVFNVVSGSLSGSNGYTIAASGSTSQGGFGLFYPNLGIIILNPDALRETVGFVAGAYTGSTGVVFKPNTGSANWEYNQLALVNSINKGGDFQARSAENISSTHYFVRLGNKEFNYSNNPTFYDASNGTLIYNDFINNPRTFPTTIGLYDDANELLAVGRFSGPVAKGIDKEILAKVRLDF